jgi:[Skp1-protein]-hydroxyproline N-acetylglucosaminyltransferase
MVDGPFVAGLASAALLLLCVLLQAPRSGRECSPRDHHCLELVRQLAALERQWAADDELGPAAGRVAARVHGAPRDEAAGEGACAATVGDVELSECLAAAASASAAAPGDAAGEPTEERVVDGEDALAEEALVQEALAEEAAAEEELAEKALEEEALERDARGVDARADDARANDVHADDARADRRGAGGVYNCSWHGPFQGDFSTGLLSKRPVIGALENVLRTCERNRECAAVASVPGDLAFRRFLLVRGRVVAQPSESGAVHYSYRCSPHEVPPLPPPTPAEPEPTIEPWKWPAVRDPSLSGYDVAGHASIFLHIASFRDSKCVETIEDALAKAQYPERLVFGVVDQRLPGEADAGRKCVPAPSECVRARTASAAAQRGTGRAPALPAVCRHLDQVRVHEMDARLANGPTAARHRADLLYHGETFLLQIDAHMIFARGWDVKAEAQWASLGNDRAVLTGYPTTAVGSVDGVSGAALRRTRPLFCGPAILEKDGVIKWPGAVEVDVDVPTAADHDGPRPIKVPYWAAGLSFSRGHRAIVVPYDCCTPALFMGEELMMATRMLTHGYDLYAFTESLVFHYYPGERVPLDPPFFFDREANDEARAAQMRASWARALALLRLPGAGAPPEAPYDIGTVRPVERLLRVWGLGWDEQSGGLSPGQDLCDIVLDGRFSFDTDEPPPESEYGKQQGHDEREHHELDSYPDQLEHEDERGHERNGDERGNEHQHGRIGDVRGHGHEREGDERGREHAHGDQDIGHELELDLQRDLDSERVSVSGHGVTEQEQGLQPDEATDLELQTEAVDHEHGFEASGLALRVTQEAERSANHGALKTLDPQTPAASESAAETVAAVASKTAEAKTGTAVATKATEAETGAAVASETAEVETGAAVATKAAEAETGAAVASKTAVAETVAAVATEIAEAETGAAVATKTAQVQTGMNNAGTPADQAVAVTVAAVASKTAEAKTGTAVATKATEAETGAAVATETAEVETGAAVATKAAEAETGAAVATKTAVAETVAAVATETAEAETGAAVATKTAQVQTGMNNAGTPADQAVAVTAGAGAVADEETTTLDDGTRSEQGAAVLAGAGAVADQEATLLNPAIESVRASLARETHERAADNCAAESPAKLTLASDGPATTSAAAETSDGAPTAGVKDQAPIADSQTESATEGRTAWEGAFADASSSADPAAADKPAPVTDDAKVVAAAATSAAPTMSHLVPDLDADTGSSRGSRGATSHSHAAGIEEGEEEELDI